MPAFSPAARKASLLHPPAESSCDHLDQPNTVNLSSFTSEQLHFMQLAATPAGYNQKQQDLSTTSHHHPFLICFPLLGWVPLPVSLLSLSSPSFLWKEKNLFPSSRSLSVPAATMSGLYSQGFSPARTLSPQIRSNPDADRYY